MAFLPFVTPGLCAALNLRIVRRADDPPLCGQQSARHGAMSTGNEDREFVRALSRGLAVIEAFGREHPEMTLSDVARQTGLSRGTARRLLLTLQRLGYVAFDGDKFSLLPRALRLGFAYLSSLSMSNLAGPAMAALTQEIGESCSIAVLDGNEIVYVARVAAKRLITDAMSIGSRLPAYSTSMGKVLLASLKPAELDAYFAAVKLVAHTPHTIVDEGELRTVIERVRRSGYATNDREIELGLRSISVPIVGKDGRVVAAMNVSGQAARVAMKVFVTDYLPVLRRTAAAVSELVAMR
jgi:IclR family pca regulon transcriptional regulator